MKSPTTRFGCVPAATALTNVKSAIAGNALQRGKVGTSLQRLNLHTDELRILTQNLDAAVSRIRDTDVALEATEYARNNILVQTGTSMLAQANLLPQSVLQLLS